MKHILFRKLFIAFASAILMDASACTPNTKQPNEVIIEHDLKTQLHSLMPQLGHRNWVLVVDSAYPFQNSDGLTMVNSELSHEATIEEVVKAIKSSVHVSANVYLDKELDYIEETDIPGISDYKSNLNTKLGDWKTKKVLHEQLISKIDSVSKPFKILVVKTDFTMPYTSVFFELDCKYWGADQEEALRNRMKSTSN
ncbi:RbsD/FucU domain-containing protein [Echinicola shivajiensis]|uniref:RbsD/FucU domain-containing protein n=1 Tax=Echinicola shivajiensis TaxID=1035916 RepID=UPI001BFC25E1|nr:RbsD/FucU domain-containing protein [Echinicola shivajiensis]